MTEAREIILEFLRGAFAPQSSAQIASNTRLGSHKLYPALDGLEREGTIKGEWAEDDAYPRRRLYSLEAAEGKRG